jgi:nucleoside 2-deoxyribosyltransferase
MGAADVIKCPIWDTDAEEFEEATGDFRCVSSQRAAGNYIITSTAAATAKGLDDREKALLTTWLIDNRKLGDSAPRITKTEIELARTWHTLSVAKRRDRLLFAISEAVETLGGKLEYKIFRGVVSLSDPIPPDTKISEKERLLAWTESTNFDEVVTLINFAKSQGLIEDGIKGLNLTFDGYTLLESLSKASQQSAQAFVAMWFAQDMAAAYVDGISPAISDCGFTPMRIDNKEHNNKIDEEIISEIRRSRFIVADFTCGAIEANGRLNFIPRGGVYYEAGFAQGLGIPVIWTCRKDQILDIHFDTRQYNHITWDNPTELREKLRVRIGAVIGDGPNKRA